MEVEDPSVISTAKAIAINCKDSVYWSLKLGWVFKRSITTPMQRTDESGWCCV
jgi:hypothetical protein